MTEYYVDASALVKRYTDEAGSTWIRQMTDPQAQPTVLLAEITLAEPLQKWRRLWRQNTEHQAASPRSNAIAF